MNKICCNDLVLLAKLAGLMQACYVNDLGPFYKHGLTLISAWISNYMPSKVRGELSIPKLQRLYGWSLRMEKSFHPTFVMEVITYPCWD